MEENNIRVEDYEDPDGRDNARKLVEEGVVEAWQRRWDLSSFRTSVPD
jgi:hypothetical protein